MARSFELAALGDRAWLIRFANEEDARAWALAARTRFGARPVVQDVVLAYRSVAVFADLEHCDPAVLEAELNAIRPVRDAQRRQCAWIELPVLYDGEDLSEVAHRTASTEQAVIEAHSGIAYTVFAIGFLPGFPYAGYLPKSLSGLPRRSSPRKRVPAGSVAIAGRQTGVYPRDSPGGWHLLGRTPLVIADLDRGHFPIRSGDQLTFRPIDAFEFQARSGEWLLVENRPPLNPTRGDGSEADPKESLEESR